MPHLSAMSSDHATSLTGVREEEHRVFLKGLIDGREDAWDEFYQRYAHRLFGYVRKIWRGPDHHLDDLVQLTLLRAVKYIGRTNNFTEEALWSWLTVLARSAIADHGRKTSRFSRLLQRFHLEPKAKSPAPPSKDLIPGLQQLDVNTQKLLRLKYEERLSVREIAQQLQVTEKAVESRLTRARNKLRKILEP